MQQTTARIYPTAPHIVPPMNHSDTIKAIRHRAGLNTSQFAVRVGVTDVTQRRWEAGISNPQRTALHKIAEEFDAWDMLGIEKPSKPAPPPWFQAWAEQQEAKLDEIMNLLRSVTR